jgi:hypothetical protein
VPSFRALESPPTGFKLHGLPLCLNPSSNVQDAGLATDIDRANRSGPRSPEPIDPTALVEVPTAAGPVRRGSFNHKRSDAGRDLSAPSLGPALPPSIPQRQAGG